MVLKKRLNGDKFPKINCILEAWFMAMVFLFLDLAQPTPVTPTR